MLILRVGRLGSLKQLTVFLLMVTSRIVDVFMGASTTYAAGAGRTGAFPFDLTWHIEHFDTQVSDIKHSSTTNAFAPFPLHLPRFHILMYF